MLAHPTLAGIDDMIVYAGRDFVGNAWRDPAHHQYNLSNLTIFRSRIQNIGARSSSHGLEHLLRRGRRGSGLAQEVLRYRQALHFVRAFVYGTYASIPEVALDPAVAKKVIAQATSHPQIRENSRDELLSEREMEVLKLAARGMGNKDIAASLHVSRRTVEGTLRSVFNKLGAGSRVEAMLYGLRRGWFRLEELP